MIYAENVLNIGRFMQFLQSLLFLPKILMFAAIERLKESKLLILNSTDFIRNTFDIIICKTRVNLLAWIKLCLQRIWLPIFLFLDGYFFVKWKGKHFRTVPTHKVWWKNEHETTEATYIANDKQNSIWSSFHFNLIFSKLKDHST